MNEDDVHRQLVSLLGPDNVSRSEPVLLRHASDALRPSRAFPGSGRLRPRPQWVVWPRSPQQVQGLVRLANEQHIPLVPFGSGTGLMGGATSAHGGVLVDLARLNGIRAVHPGDRTVTAEAGTVLSDVNAKLEAHGLMLGHDPWTLPVATVGGTISTNSLGYLGALYGSMGEQVLGLEAVLPDGNLISTRALPKTSTGMALHQLLVGTEGCFGIITAATLKAFPLPERRSLYALRFPTFESAFRAVDQMYALGLTPALVDMGEEFEPGPAPGWESRPTEAGTELFLGFEGLKEVVRAQARRARELWGAEGGVQRDTRVAQRFWKNRHAAAEGYMRRMAQADRAPFLQPSSGPLIDYVHVALPASQVLEYRRRCIELARRHRVHLREFGLWNRPELFSLVLMDPEGSDGRLGQAADAVLTLAQDLGGSMEYCHGVGLRLAHLMAREHGYGLEVLRKLKHTLDPENIMNPGKLAL
ncbi:MAG TPA: FAD-binding oxidoreductase [Dehalococcoidia bacterium]|nr:FAD-binding oxidoreductase [Dehalococcoidia bacterium]